MSLNFWRTFPWHDGYVATDARGRKYEIACDPEAGGYVVYRLDQFAWVGIKKTLVAAKHAAQRHERETQQ